jgi:hypothetical protein
MKGRSAYNKMWTSSRPILTQLLAGFEPEEAQALLGFLRRLVDNTATTSRRRNKRRRKVAPVPA